MARCMYREHYPDAPLSHYLSAHLRRPYPKPYDRGAGIGEWASTGGWFIVDQVEAVGTTDTYAIALEANGIVTGIEILKCMPNYGQVREDVWRAQFNGKKFGDLGKKDEITFVSGSTRSAEAITTGVRKVLITFNMLVQQPAP